MIFIQQIRTNDVVNDPGKQIELGKAFMSMHGWVEGEYPVTVVYRSISVGKDFDGLNIETSFKVRGEERGGDRKGADCKEYSNGMEGLPPLKSFFVNTLGLTEADKNGFFILDNPKGDSKNFDLYVVRETETQSALELCSALKKENCVFAEETIAENTSSPKINKTLIDFYLFLKSKNLDHYFSAFQRCSAYNYSQRRRHVYEIESRDEALQEIRLIKKSSWMDDLKKSSNGGCSGTEENASLTQYESFLGGCRGALSEVKQKIIFGAPGTGKSNALKIESEEKFDVRCVERVTFHPNYSYAQFVGTYKPVSSGFNSSLVDNDVQRVVSVLQDTHQSTQEKYDILYDAFNNAGNLTRLPLLLGLYTDGEFSTRKKDGNATIGDNEVERNHGAAIRPYVTLGLSENVSYKYVPGPFMRTLVNALNDPTRDYLLIIEEINRANVAAVFGDVFQLLDRKNGVSEYPINASEDVKHYLKNNGIECDKIQIPSNMYIWATMNSADQGVFPMDSAFKRRWEFEYINIDNGESWDYTIPLPNNESINWNVLRKAINCSLKKIAGVNEDKLLGPYFLGKEMLEKANQLNNTPSNTEEEQIKVGQFLKAFKSKVLMYLFEDVCKMRPKELFAGLIDMDRIHYSDVCNRFDSEGIKIFGFVKTELEQKYLI